jgi:hypothetical protein
MYPAVSAMSRWKFRISNCNEVAHPASARREKNEDMSHAEARRRIQNDLLCAFASLREI